MTICVSTKIEYFVVFEPSRTFPQRCCVLLLNLADNFFVCVSSCSSKSSSFSISFPFSNPADDFDSEILSNSAMASCIAFSNWVFSFRLLKALKYVKNGVYMNPTFSCDVSKSILSHSN